MRNANNSNIGIRLVRREILRAYLLIGFVKTRGTDVIINARKRGIGQSAGTGYAFSLGQV